VAEDPSWYTPAIVALGLLIAAVSVILLRWVGERREEAELAAPLPWKELALALTPEGVAVVRCVPDEDGQPGYEEAGLWPFRDLDHAVELAFQACHDEVATFVVLAQPNADDASPAATDEREWAAGLKALMPDWVQVHGWLDPALAPASGAVDPQLDVEPDPSVPPLPPPTDPAHLGPWQRAMDALVGYHRQEYELHSRYSIAGNG
jgi:hypothetical protein